VSRLLSRRPTQAPRWRDDRAIFSEDRYIKHQIIHFKRLIPLHQVTSSYRDSGGTEDLGLEELWE
jgi:hypothetical protein